MNTISREWGILSSDNIPEELDVGMTCVKRSAAKPMEKGHMHLFFPSLTILLSRALLKRITWDFIIVIDVFMIEEYLFF